MAREPQTAFTAASKRGGHASHRSGRRGVRRWPPGATDFAAAERTGDDAGRSPPQDHDREAGGQRIDPSLGIALRQQLFHGDGTRQASTQPGGRALRPDEAAVHRDIVELLEGLNTTIDVARHVLTTATDALEKQAGELQQTALRAPQPRQRPPRRRRWVLGSAASALVVLIGLGWLLYDGVSLVQEPPPPQAPIKVVKTQPVETVASPQRAPAQAAVIPPAPVDEPTVPLEQAEVQVKEETPAPSAEPLRGRPGEPIPLGIEAPQLEGSAQVSVMVQALPEGARLTAGQRVSGDTWILKSEQIPGAALLLPSDFAADQVVLDLTFVASDGRIPEAHSIVALVEQDPAPASPAQSPDAVAPVAPAPAQAAAEPSPAPAQTVAETPDTPAATIPGLTRAAQPAETPLANLSPSEEASRFVPGQAAPQVRDGTSEEVQPTAEQTQETPAPSDAETNDASITAAINEASEPAATQSASATPPPAEEPNASQPEPAGDKPSDTPEPTRTASVNTDVNMRARPDNDAEVLAVVPKGRSVDVIRCRAWCEVTFEGKRGFIYKGFIEGGTAASASGASSAASATPTASGGAIVVRSQARTSQSSQGWFGRIRSFFTPSR